MSFVEMAQKGTLRLFFVKNKQTDGWGLRRFIKQQASPASVPSNSQTTNETSQNKSGNDEDVSSKVKASPPKMVDIGPCSSMPFTVHDDSDAFPRGNEKAIVSPDAMSTADSQTSSLSVQKGKGMARRESTSDVVPVSKASRGRGGARKDADNVPVSKTTGGKGGVRKDSDVIPVNKAGGGKDGARRESTGGSIPISKDGEGKQGAIKSGPGRPKSTPTAKASGCQSSASGEVTSSFVEASETCTQQRKRRRTSSTGGGKKAAKPSPVANSSSSEVDIESVTPQESKPAPAKPSVNPDVAQERLGGEVSKHLFTGSSPTASADSKKPATPSKPRAPSRRDSNHHAKKSTKKSASSQDDGGGGGKLSVGKPANGTLTDIGSIIKDIEVPRLLSPTISAYSGESNKRDLPAEASHIPTLTCGKPSIVVRLHSARLHRAPQPRSKGGRSGKTRQESGAAVATDVPPRSGSGDKGRGAAGEVPALTKSSNLKSGGGGKKICGDAGLSSSPTLPSSSSASPAVSSLPAKRKKEKDKDHPSSAKKQKSTHVPSKQASTKTAATDSEV